MLLDFATFDPNSLMPIQLLPIWLDIKLDHVDRQCRQLNLWGIVQVRRSYEQKTYMRSHECCFVCTIVTISQNPMANESNMYEG